MKKIYKELFRRYKQKEIDVTNNEIDEFIENQYLEAIKSYEKLVKPVLKKNFYQELWIWEEITKDIANRIKTDTSGFEATADFYESYTSGIKSDKRKLNKKFVAMIKERNKFSLKKGFKSRLEMSLSNNKIPISQYEKFNKNLDKIVSDNKFFKKDCLICNVNPFLFDEEKLRKMFEDDYPILIKVRNKLNIGFGENYETRYIKEFDSFEIDVEKNEKYNHRMMGLVHELAHVVLYLNYFKKEINPFKKGVYFREKQAIKIELKFLKKHFPVLYIARLKNILSFVCQTLFEIELYKNPDQDLGKLYAECINRCFRREKQTENLDYLLENKIVYGIFEFLPYSIGYINVFENLLS